MPDKCHLHMLQGKHTTAVYIYIYMSSSDTVIIITTFGGLEAPGSWSLGLVTKNCTSWWLIFCNRCWITVRHFWLTLPVVTRQHRICENARRSAILTYFDPCNGALTLWPTWWQFHHVPGTAKVAMGGTTKAPWPWTSDRSVTGQWQVENLPISLRGWGKGYPFGYGFGPWDGGKAGMVKWIAEARCGNV